MFHKTCIPILALLHDIQEPIDASNCVFSSYLQKSVIFLTERQRNESVDSTWDFGILQIQISLRRCLQILWRWHGIQRPERCPRASNRPGADWDPSAGDGFLQSLARLTLNFHSHPCAQGWGRSRVRSLPWRRRCFVIAPPYHSVLRHMVGIGFLLLSKSVDGQTHFCITHTSVLFWTH